MAEQGSAAKEGSGLWAKRMEGRSPARPSQSRQPRATHLGVSKSSVKMGIKMSSLRGLKAFTETTYRCRWKCLLQARALMKSHRDPVEGGGGPRYGQEAKLNEICGAGPCFAIVLINQLKY